ncbi:Binding partner of ACD11 1-like protein [Drosera capensis]
MSNSIGEPEFYSFGLRVVPLGSYHFLLSNQTLLSRSIVPTFAGPRVSLRIETCPILLLCLQISSPLLLASPRHPISPPPQLQIMSVRTVKVSNVSLGASQRDLTEFFSFSGDIEYVEIKSEDEHSQTAHVTFKDSQGAETAVLLTGATIVDKTVTIVLDPDYQLPPAALAPQTEGQGKGAESALRKAEDVVSSMLAKGFILGKDAVNKANSFDEKHQLTSTASAKVASLDKRIGLTEKISMGTAVVNDKVREVDQKYQVTEKTKSALAAAEQKVSSAGSAIMKNRYVFTGATWVTGAFNKVAKAAGDVGQNAKEKAVVAEDEQKKKVVEDFAQVHLSDPESPKAGEPGESNIDIPTSASPGVDVSGDQQKEHLKGDGAQDGLGKVTLHKMISFESCFAISS